MGGGGIRDAASVMIVRPAVDRCGVEVYTIRRPATMAFAAGMLAFPGGAVDPADRDEPLPWAGPPARSLVTALTARDAGHAKALVAAAVRETFEEVGVLFATSADPAGLDGVGDLDGSSWEQRRRDLAAGTVTLAGMFATAGLVLRADLLIPWAHWLTPEGSPRRYDTRFFAAAVPAGQQPRLIEGEAAAAGWVDPAWALAEAAAGRLPMMAPQRALLSDLATAASVDAVLAARRDTGRVTA